MKTICAECGQELADGFGIHDCPSAPEPATPEYLTDDQKLELITTVENDVWVILQKRYAEADPGMEMFTDPLQLIELCQRIRFGFPTVTIQTGRQFTKLEYMLDDNHHYHEV